MEIYKDKTRSAGERAADLLSKMDLDEKMTQLVGYNPALWSSDDFDTDFPEGAGQVSMLGVIGMKDCYTVARFHDELQEKIMARTKHHIPAFFHMEALCGAVGPDAASFPGGTARGASFDPKLELIIGELVGRQAAAVGGNQPFAPVLDVTRDARFGRTGESYGEDPTLAAAMGVAYARGIQKENPEDGRKVGAVAKHFLGFHNSQGGIHAATCDIPERLLREVYAKPFQAAITEGGLKGIMPCYNAINGEPVSGSRNILTGLLREEMGFEGVTVSDYSAVSELYGRHKVTESPEEGAVRALWAGMDQELPSRCCFNQRLKEMFESGQADMALLDRAVYDVLLRKFEQGLFEYPMAQPPQIIRKVYFNEKTKELSLKSARESIVLLKNNGILPLDNRPQRIAVIGHHGASVRTLFGGYTYVSLVETNLEQANTMAGIEQAEDMIAAMAARESYPGSWVKKEAADTEGAVRAMVPGIRSLVEEMTEYFDQAQVTYAYGYPFAGNDTAGYLEALEAAGTADMVVMTVGGKYGMGLSCSIGEGIDCTDINLPKCQERLIEQIGALGKRLIVIHFGGRPISSDAADRYADAIIEAWCPGECGAKAVVSVLSGDYNPAGRLPVSVAYTAGQLPVFYNHHNGAGLHQNCGSGFPDYVDCLHRPRYCFGHGLSYTTFEYGLLELAHKEIHCHSTQEIRLTVENTGECDGDEVVQLYIRDPQASMVRPVMELAGFSRVFLKKGEKKTLRFMLDLGQLAFLDMDMRWKIEKGEFQVLVGSSSEDIRLQDSFYVTENGFVDGKMRKFWAACEII